MLKSLVNWYGSGLPRQLVVVVDGLVRKRFRGTSLLRATMRAPLKGETGSRAGGEAPEESGEGSGPEGFGAFFFFFGGGVWVWREA